MERCVPTQGARTALPACPATLARCKTLVINLAIPRESREAKGLIKIQEVTDNFGSNRQNFTNLFQLPSRLVSLGTLILK
jgi:hypothetical protein